MDHVEPVVLELAPLPREQLGPFFILGIAKDADAEQIDAAWAERIKGARRGQHRLALEDINWAREVLSDPERRVRADVTSINLDTTDAALRQLAERWSMTAGPTWPAEDAPMPPADYTPAIDVPAAAEILASAAVPDIPLELPILPALLERWRPSTLDPWTFDIGMETEERHE